MKELSENEIEEVELVLGDKVKGDKKMGRLHTRAEDYAYQEIKEGTLRGKR